MIIINLEIESYKNNITNEVVDSLDFGELNNKLSKALEEGDLSIKLSKQDDNNIHIEEINIIDDVNRGSNLKETDLVIQDKKSNTNTAMKVLKSAGKVGEEFFDSTMKEFLKKKFKWNYSVYNDGKKAVIAASKKDVPTFLKSATDSILYTIKKIPSNTKKIIKNTKNVAIDEVFSWKNNE